MNLKEPGPKKTVIRNSKYSASNKTEASSSFGGINVEHRSPIPVAKQSPLTNKAKNNVLTQSNNVGLSSSHLIKLKSAGVEYGGVSMEQPKGKLQKFHIEKRVSKSSSSKAKNGENWSGSRNKGNVGQITSDYIQISNHNNANRYVVPNFYQPIQNKMSRGRSTKPAKTDSIIRKSFPVEECLDEDSEDSDNGCMSSESDYTDSEEEKDEKADNTSKVISREFISSANPKGKFSDARMDSLSRDESIPSMSRHLRRHKKIP